MNFSNDVFRSSRTATTNSGDNMEHSSLVMACRFGWTCGPDDQNKQQTTQPAQLTPSPPSYLNPSFGSTSKRFAPCRGRLYHQLACSHRIRTDVVEDCGLNCLDPPTSAQNLPFYCHECIEKESDRIWNERETQHNATYPSRDQMSKEEYEQWYEEHRQLEAEFFKDRMIYELEMKARTRPSNFCSALEASKEETDIAAELDSLSLTMVSSNDSIADQSGYRAHRISLPNDPSEQLHWGLNSLSINRGSCGVEYSAHQRSNGIPRQMAIEDQLWRQPQARD